MASVMMCGAVLMAEHVLSTALPSSPELGYRLWPQPRQDPQRRHCCIGRIRRGCDDTKVTGANMATSNGIVHVIDTVLSPLTATNPMAAITTATLATPVNPTDAVAVHPNKAVPVRQTSLFPSQSPTPPNVPPPPRRRQAAAPKLPPLPRHRQAAAAVTLCAATALPPPQFCCQACRQHLAAAATKLPLPSCRCRRRRASQAAAAIAL